jgi:hypothetical protein
MYTFVWQSTRVRWMASCRWASVLIPHKRRSRPQQSPCSGAESGSRCCRSTPTERHRLLLRDITASPCSGEESGSRSRSTATERHRLLLSLRHYCKRYDRRCVIQSGRDGLSAKFLSSVSKHDNFFSVLNVFPSVIKLISLLIFQKITIYFCWIIYKIWEIIYSM